MKNFVKSIVFIFIILSSYFSNAQVVKFRKVIGNSGYDYGMSAKQTSDKGYIIGGSTSSFGNGTSDVYLVKTDSLGIALWQKTFGGINIDRGMCVRQTNDKGFIVTGYTNSYGAGGYDVYLIKTDSTGIEQWEKTYGGTDWDFANCVEQTTDGGYIICGSTYSYGKGNVDCYLIKTNSSGDTLWTKTFGGVNEDIANSVVQTSDGGYILTGTTKSMGDTLGDFYTVKTNAFGDTLWTNIFGGSNLDYGNDVLESINGGYIVGGETQSFSYIVGSSDGIIEKISVSGQTGATYSTGFSSPLFDNIVSITEDNIGRIAMIGMTTSLGYGAPGDVYFNIVDSNFNWINSNTYGSPAYDIGYSIENTNDRGFIVCGITEGYNSNGLDNIYLIKTDTLGTTTTTVDIEVTSVETVNSPSNESIILYPNPADKMIHLILKSTFEDEFLITITDIIGRQYFSQKGKIIRNNPININLSTHDFKNGMYFMSIQNNNSIQTKQFIINH